MPRAASSASEPRPVRRRAHETRVGVLVLEFAHFSAQVPQLARFMMREADRSGPRLRWLIERHVRPQFEWVRDALGRAQRSGLVGPGDPAHLVFLILGSSSMFAQAARAELLLGPQALAPEQVDTYADPVVRAILPDAASTNGGRSAT